MRATALFVPTLLVSVGAVAPAFAQERVFNFALRGGVGTAPAYPGSDSYEVVPDLGFTFGALKWGPIDAGEGVRATPRNGFALRGAFRYLGERDSSDNSELAGLEDIDATLELGVGAVYRQTDWQVFGEVRQGFGGHEGVTGSLGADAIFRPSSRLTILAGPRVNFGDSDYAQTYFGVSTAESITSQFAAYDAGGGVLGVGAEIEAIYELDDRWALEGTVSYERLQNDAADSPITQAGSEDQWRVSVGLSRVFNIRF